MSESPTDRFCDSMPGDGDRERSPREDRDRDRDRRRYSREDREYSSHRRRRRSTSRSRSPPCRPIRINQESSPQRPPSRNRSLSPYSKRAQQTKREPTSPRNPRYSPSPEAWGSHQHDVKHNKTNPPGPPVEKQKPNYGLSGLLAAATNMKNGTVLKYNEPTEGRRCKGWRIYIFKDGKEIDVLNLDGASHFLVGRDQTVLHPFHLTYYCGL